MERMKEISSEIRERENLISFNLAAGYLHIHLHPLMIDFFLFRYAENTYRCIALPFGRCFT